METTPYTPEEKNAALFAQLVLQQTNMAIMLLGRMPHPQTGETVRDLEAAVLFIDQLEMLEAKTKGNLGRDEEQMLKQSLMTLRMAFVEASQQPTPEKAKTVATPAHPATAPEIAKAAEPDATADQAQKKFVKKY